jgi:hypothetical protein
MHGYILATGARLAPFGDPIGDALILNRRLEDCQREVLGPHCAEVSLIAGPDEIREPEFLLAEDSFFFTRHLLRKALQLGAAVSGPVRFALAACNYVREKAPLGGLDVLADGRARLPLVWWKDEPFDAARLDDLPLITITIEEREHVPENLKLLREDLEMTFSVTREGALSLRHWSHLLDANQVALTAYWWDLSWRSLLWYAWRGVTAFSPNMWKLLGRCTVRGRGCDIHPTAWVGLSVLGDNVSIGPHSVVLGSHLGDGAKVEGLSDLAFAVVGEKAVVSFRTKINFSVFYPYSLASYPAMQMCVLGRRALHMGGSFPIDMKLSHGELFDVKVRHEGQIVSSGKKFLGICLGHGAILGTGLWANCGIEIPNDYIIVRDQAELVTKIPPGFERVPLSLQDGALLPYGQTARQLRTAPEPPEEGS